MACPFNRSPQKYITELQAAFGDHGTSHGSAQGKHAQDEQAQNMQIENQQKEFSQGL